MIVSSVALKYLYQRATCPRVWTRTAAYDPELVMRGRYLSLQLTGRRLQQHAALREKRAISAQHQRRPQCAQVQHQCARHRLVPGEARSERQQAHRDSRS